MHIIAIKSAIYISLADKWQPPAYTSYGHFVYMLDSNAYQRLILVGTVGSLIFYFCILIDIEELNEYSKQCYNIGLYNECK